MKISPAIKEHLKKYLEDLMEEERKSATIISSFKLKDDDLKVLYDSVPFLKNAKKRFEVDENLMAGVIIKIGTKMIDLSLNGQLNKLKNLIYATY